MKRTRPLFQFDAGWLFLAAGLALCVVVVLIPARRDLFELRQQLAVLDAQERHASQRLRAYQQFLVALDDGENTSLVERLAATQFNVLPAGETPVLLVSNRNAAVTDWIDEQVPTPTSATVAWPDTRLTRLAIGPFRLWLLGAGVMSVFVGLIIGTETFARVMKESPDANAEDNELLGAAPCDPEARAVIVKADDRNAPAEVNELDAGDDVAFDRDDVDVWNEVDLDVCGKTSEDDDVAEEDDEVEFDSECADADDDEIDDEEYDEEDAYDDKEDIEASDDVDDGGWEDEHEIDELLDESSEVLDDASDDEMPEETTEIVTIAPNERQSGDVIPDAAGKHADSKGGDGAFPKGLFDRYGSS